MCLFLTTVAVVHTFNLVVLLQLCQLQLTLLFCNYRSCSWCYSFVIMTGTVDTIVILFGLSGAIRAFANDSCELCNWCWMLFFWTYFSVITVTTTVALVTMSVSKNPQELGLQIPEEATTAWTTMKILQILQSVQIVWRWNHQEIAHRILFM